MWRLEHHVDVEIHASFVGWFDSLGEKKSEKCIIAFLVEYIELDWS